MRDKRHKQTQTSQQVFTVTEGHKTQRNTDITTSVHCYWQIQDTKKHRHHNNCSLLLRDTRHRETDITIVHCYWQTQYTKKHRYHNCSLLLTDTIHKETQTSQQVFISSKGHKTQTNTDITIVHCYWQTQYTKKHRHHNKCSLLLRDTRHKQTQTSQQLFTFTEGHKTQRNTDITTSVHCYWQTQDTKKHRHHNKCSLLLRDTRHKQTQTSQQLFTVTEGHKTQTNTDITTIVHCYWRTQDTKKHRHHNCSLLLTDTRHKETQKSQLFTVTEGHKTQRNTDITTSVHCYWGTQDTNKHRHHNKCSLLLRDTRHKETQTSQQVFTVTEGHKTQRNTDITTIVHCYWGTQDTNKYRHHNKCSLLLMDTRHKETQTSQLFTVTDRHKTQRNTDITTSVHCYWGTQDTKKHRHHNCSLLLTDTIHKETQTSQQVFTVTEGHKTQRNTDITTIVHCYWRTQDTEKHRHHNKCSLLLTDTRHKETQTSQQLFTVTEGHKTQRNTDITTIVHCYWGTQDTKKHRHHNNCSLLLRDTRHKETQTSQLFTVTDRHKTQRNTDITTIVHCYWRTQYTKKHRHHNNCSLLLTDTIHRETDITIVHCYWQTQYTKKHRHHNKCSFLLKDTRHKQTQTSQLFTVTDRHNTQRNTDITTSVHCYWGTQDTNKHRHHNNCSLLLRDTRHKQTQTSQQVFTVTEGHKTQTNTDITTSVHCYWQTQDTNKHRHHNNCSLLLTDTRHKETQTSQLFTSTDGHKTQRNTDITIVHCYWRTQDTNKYRHHNKCSLLLTDTRHKETQTSQQVFTVTEGHKTQRNTDITTSVHCYWGTQDTNKYRHHNKCSLLLMDTRNKETQTSQLFTVTEGHNTQRNTDITTSVHCYWRTQDTNKHRHHNKCSFLLKDTRHKQTQTSQLFTVTDRHKTQRNTDITTIVHCYWQTQDTKKHRHHNKCSLLLTDTRHKETQTSQQVFTFTEGHKTQRNTDITTIVHCYWQTQYTKKHRHHNKCSLLLRDTIHKETQTSQQVFTVTEGHKTQRNTDITTCVHCYWQTQDTKKHRHHKCSLLLTDTRHKETQTSQQVFTVTDGHKTQRNTDITTIVLF